MKRIKIVALLMSFTLIFAVGCASGQKSGEGPFGMEKIEADTEYEKSETRTPQPVHKVYYDYIGGADVMPIGGWWGPYETESDSINLQEPVELISDRIYRLLAEAGINVITVTDKTYLPGRDNAVIDRVMELSAKYKIGTYVQEKTIRNIDNVQDMRALVDKIYEYENCIGIFSVDEPGNDKFDMLADLFEVYYAAGYENKDIYTNILPEGARTYTGGTGEPITYDEYVTQFLDKVKPRFLSYDSYPFGYENQGVDNLTGFFHNLSYIYGAAKSRNIPFWAFVQTGGQWEAQVGKPSEPLFPDEGETLWNVNVLLAYGAKCIQYFTLVQPAHFADAGQEFDYTRSGMIGAAGNINRWYWYAQKANRQISAIDHVLMNATNMGVIAAGERIEKNVRGEEKLTDESGKALRSFRELENITGEEVMVGCFDHKGKTALYIVNNDVEKNNEITLNFSKKYGYNVYQNAEKTSVTGKNMNLSLAPGEGVLVELL